MNSSKEFQAGVKVAGGGVLTGSSRRCQLEGCLGVRLYVRWDDGKLTMPCTKGMTYDDVAGSWKIR
jgi:hypothetical protein